MEYCNWKLPCFHTLLFIFATLFAEIESEEEAKTQPGNEEWHMDFVPTGYLPDSVYRDLAWYGILQIQPLYRSTKHKVVAQWIWQNTLGRPYVIMENQPQFSQSRDGASYHTVVEEAAKWSREQRTAQDVLMENIKTGGNGLTVRTVISAKKKTVYIIQNGKYYECPTGSEPDMDAYRVQANMHERKCTSGKASVPIAMDPCIEAETAPLEYSFHEGWMFCLGDRERDNNYFSDGVLDCGNKTKISLEKFLDECAIDNNVVITYYYFGDEPRKDLLHNTTLCTTWDPCRVSYLYRYEPPAEVPPLPIQTRDPCDTTICPDCLIVTTTKKIITTTIKPTIKWIPTTAATAKSKKCYLCEGNLGTPRLIKAHYNNEYIPGFFDENLETAHIAYEGKEVIVSNFEVLCPPPTQKYSWVFARDGQVPPEAVPGGITHTGETLYFSRVIHSYKRIPGKVHPSKGHAYVPYNGLEIPFREYYVLVKVIPPIPPSEETIIGENN